MILLNELILDLESIGLGIDVADYFDLHSSDVTRLELLKHFRKQLVLRSHYSSLRDAKNTCVRLLSELDGLNNNKEE